MKRALAVFGAVVMVVVSIVIRSAIDDSPPSSDHITIACITELADVCKTLTSATVRVEDASVTAKAIADGTAGIDGWVTFHPWPEMTAVLAQHEVASRTVAVQSSPLVIAMVRERADALAPTCGGAVTWKCIGDDNGRQWSDLGGRPEWGALKVGLLSPASATGALLVGDAATSYFGKSNFATNDFDDQFRVWKTNLLSSPGSFTDFLQFFPAKFSAVGAVQALVDPGARSSEVVFINSGGSATVVISDLTGRGGRVINDLQQKLKASGWSDLQASPVPDAGVLLALSGLTG